MRFYFTFLNVLSFLRLYRTVYNKSSIFAVPVVWNSHLRILLVRGRLNVTYFGAVDRIIESRIISLECEDCPSGALAVSVAWQSQLSCRVKFVAWLNVLGPRTQSRGASVTFSSAAIRRGVATDFRCAGVWL
jgi:hypothetical protein